MSMRASEIALVQATFAHIAARPEALVLRFYARLFALDPTIRVLFPVEMAEQRQKLFDALALLVNNLEQPEVITPQLQDLGRRHMRYGVEERDYATLEVALLAALEESLGAEWTDAVGTAWTSAYHLLRDAMCVAYHEGTTEQNASSSPE